MIDDALVIDAVVHGYNLTAENQKSPQLCQELAGMLYHGVHQNFSPRGQQEWILPVENFMNGANPEMLAPALFAESQTDMCIYHGVPTFGLFKDGGSPLWVGKEIQQKYPGRVLLYGPVSPWQHNAVEEVDRLVDEEGVVGIKFYPMDVVDGEVRSWRLDDPDTTYPVLERIRDRGLKSVAIHKAIPLGRVPTEPFLVDDVEGAATDFPELTFEIVHGGFAYLEETAFLAARFPNIAINLEGASAYAVNAPRKFAEILGTLMFWGAADRIIWATGCMAVHPRPFVEKFWNMEMPEDLMEGYGYPPLTEDVKKAILSGNIARILDIDLDAHQKQFADDAFSQQAELTTPWSALNGHA